MPGVIGVHVHCRDWTGVPFVGAQQLVMLRALYRRHTSPRIRRLIVSAGTWLRDAERRWPEGAAAFVSTYRQRLRSLEYELHQLGVDVTLRR